MQEAVRNYGNGYCIHIYKTTSKELRIERVGGLEHFLFSHILGIIIPTD